MAIERCRACRGEDYAAHGQPPCTRCDGHVALIDGQTVESFVDQHAGLLLELWTAVAEDDPDSTVRLDRAMAEAQAFLTDHAGRQYEASPAHPRFGHSSEPNKET